jgi:hypothetical protein
VRSTSFWNILQQIGNPKPGGLVIHEGITCSVVSESGLTCFIRYFNYCKLNNVAIINTKDLLPPWHVILSLVVIYFRYASVLRLVWFTDLYFFVLWMLINPFCKKTNTNPQLRLEFDNKPLLILRIFSLRDMWSFHLFTMMFGPFGFLPKDLNYLDFQSVAGYSRKTSSALNVFINYIFFYIIYILKIEPI